MHEERVEFVSEGVALRHQLVFGVAPVAGGAAARGGARTAFRADVKIASGYNLLCCTPSGDLCVHAEPPRVVLELVAVDPAQREVARL